MKTIKLFLSVSFLFISISLFSQQTYSIKDTTILLDKKMRPAMTVTIDTKSEKDIKRFTKKFFKQKDIKLTSEKNFHSAEKVVLPEISSKNSDLIIEIIPQGQTSANMSICMRFGYDLYVNGSEYPNEYLKLRKTFSSLIKQYLTSFYDEEITSLRKDLEKTQKEKNKLVEVTRKASKDMDKANKKIYKLRKKQSKATDAPDPEINAKITELEKEYADNEKLLKTSNVNIKIASERIQTITDKLNIIQQKINGISVE